MEAVGHPLPLHDWSADAVKDLDERIRAVLVGPGLGRDTPADVVSVLEVDDPLVLDGDALIPEIVDHLASRPAPTVLTPHAGEFRRLFGAEPTYGVASQAARTAKMTVLLKGNPTFVVGAERWVVSNGGPELATIGTGDVLAGMIAALWARGLDADVAARSAAYWHGRAGAALARHTAVTAAELAIDVGRYAW